MSARTVPPSNQPPGPTGGSYKAGHSAHSHTEKDGGYRRGSALAPVLPRRASVAKRAGHQPIEVQSHRSITGLSVYEAFSVAVRGFFDEPAGRECLRPPQGWKSVQHEARQSTYSSGPTL